MQPDPAGRSDAPTLAADEVEGSQTGRGAQTASGLDDVLETRDGARVLGRYVVMGTLGQGGMGTVLRAFDPKLDRRVAIKVLHRELSELQTQRLLREAQALARLSHPNVVQVYEVDERAGRTFVVMELVEGQTLTEWMETRPDWRRCVDVFVQAGEGLAAAHEQGLVHRDFKPGNAILDERGRTRVLDFGLARPIDPDYEEPEASPRAELSVSSGPLNTPLTRTGAMMGTPAYMSLEQMYGHSVDARSDQFSFCVSLYEALYGERPYEGESVGALMGVMMDASVRSAPAGSRVPRRLRRAVLRGLRPEADQRWPSMNELLEELRRCRAPRGRWWTGLAVGGGLVVLGVGLFRNPEDRRCTGAPDELAEVWNDARRTAVAEALREREAGPRAVARLDEYAAEWIATRTEVCEATAVRQEQSQGVMSLRTSCLRRRRGALDAIVDVLEQELQSRGSVDEVLSYLPGLSTCDDVEALQREDLRVPPPEDPAVAQRVEELHEKLMRVRAIHGAGHIERALELVEPLVTEAQSLDYGPLLAEIEVQHGLLLGKNGQVQEAEQTLLAAHDLAARHGHDAVLVGAALLLANNVGHGQGRPAEGLVWGRVALSTATFLGSDEQISGSHNGLGAAYSAMGNHERAAHHFEQAIAARERANGGDSPDLVPLLNNLGSALTGLRRYDRAKTVLLRAMAIGEATWAGGHFVLGDTMNNLGSVYHFGYEDHAKAAEWYARALEMKESLLGPEHPKLGTNVLNLGLMLSLQGDHEQAEPIQRRAVALYERSNGSRRSLAVALHNLSNTLAARGKRDEAIEHLRRALEIREEVLGPEHHDVAYTMGPLAHRLREYGRLDEAALEYRRALPRFEALNGPEHADVAEILMGLADSELGRGEMGEARKHAERAIAIATALEQPHAAQLAESRFVLARALWDEPGQRERARELAALAQADHPKPELVQRWLAEHDTP